MTNANPVSYSERVRLAQLIGDARAVLAEDWPRAEWRDLAKRIGALEAYLKMLADSAEIVMVGN